MKNWNKLKMESMSNLTSLQENKLISNEQLVVRVFLYPIQYEKHSNLQTS